MTLRERVLTAFSERADAAWTAHRNVAPGAAFGDAVLAEGRAQAWAAAFDLLEELIPAERAGWPADGSRLMAADERAQLQAERAEWQDLAQQRALRIVELEARAGHELAGVKAALEAVGAMLALVARLEWSE